MQICTNPGMGEWVDVSTDDLTKYVKHVFKCKLCQQEFAMQPSGSMIYDHIRNHCNGCDRRESNVV